jgi:hypothetical protein
LEDVTRRHKNNSAIDGGRSKESEKCRSEEARRAIPRKWVKSNRITSDSMRKNFESDCKGIDNNGRASYSPETEEGKGNY